jgi:FkbM family methyltransferase
LVYAFEPDPRTYDALKRASIDVGNYHLFQIAISETSGMAQFNLASYYAASSLLEFSDTAKLYWPLHASCFDQVATVCVETIRLDEFVVKQNIEQIDYLSVDAQGMDLSVLKSLGDKISIVEAGQVEVTNKNKNPLYKNSFNYDDLIEFLANNNFDITNIEFNDQYCNELNIGFKKRKP